MRGGRRYDFQNPRDLELKRATTEDIAPQIWESEGKCSGPFPLLLSHRLPSPQQEARDHGHSPRPP